jgi:beta-xylosidase
VPAAVSTVPRPPGAHDAASLPPWLPDLGDGRYQNPILFADYSDPDAIRVGLDYWLTSSSFSHVPGLPILHSRDLVNWTLVNHALPALRHGEGSAPGSAAGIAAGQFEGPRHGGGVWAPALRHHAGRFWIYYPDPDFGIFLTTASDPRGQWSVPALVKGGNGLIDPCPLWDDDGQVYLVHGWARSRSGKNNHLTLNRLSADGSRVLDGEGVVIIDENKSSRGFQTLEGPKLYKRGDTYWIFAPVGGVATGSQAVYRAKTIDGPYEARIVLAQGASAINGPHQGAWVDTPGGEHWFLHFQDRGPFGRVVHLQPMAWRSDGWPAMGTGVATGTEIGEPVLVHQKPVAGAAPATGPFGPAVNDEFASHELGRQWQWQASPRAGWHSLTANPGWLRLACLAPPAASTVPPVPAASHYDTANLLLQKFPSPVFTATTALEFSGAREGDAAGLMVFGHSYAWIGLRRTPSGVRLVQGVNIDAHESGPEREAASIPAPGLSVVLGVTVARDARCHFAYSVDGKAFSAFGEEFQATAGKWVGAKVGLFAAALPGRSGSGYADFAFFRLTA